MNPSTKRVAMVKRVANLWLSTNARPDYRVTVYAGSENLQNLPGLLRAFRDGRSRISSLKSIPDLGMDVGMDRIEMWSSDREGLTALENWLQRRGCDTTGIW